LTPPPRPALPVASALAGKEKIMRAAAIIGLLIPFAAAAQQAASQRLMAEDFSLAAAQPGNIQTAVWADRLAALRANRQALQRVAPSAHLTLIAQVWTTTFTSNGRSYVVSALNDGCSSSSALPNTLTCPTRVAELSGGKLRVIADITLQVSSVRGEAGYDASSNSQSQFMTIASFNPTTRSISFTDISNGERSPLDVRVPLP
jgi:Tfp pilus assembly protein PilV